MEADGIIYVWYHPNKAAPKWDVARIPACPDGAWVLAGVHEWVVNIHCREIPENGHRTPEPATWATALLGLGLAGWLTRRRRRRP